MPDEGAFVLYIVFQFFKYIILCHTLGTNYILIQQAWKSEMNFNPGWSQSLQMKEIAVIVSNSYTVCSMQLTK